MSILKNLKARLASAVTTYTGDTVFLKAAAAAAANVTAADGTIADAEVDAALAGMMANEVLRGFYTPAKIEEAVSNALNNAKTRAGRAVNRRDIEALATRPPEQRQDVFLIAADVADSDTLGDAERKALEEIGKALNVDAAKLLG